VISIRDTGPGINAAQFPFIFDRFYRGDEARTQSVGLNGLGLAISKKIIDLHAGRIDVASIAGEGSTFTLTLPIQQPGHSSSGTAVEARTLSCRR
jgi:two-component system sensor histidine kinase BaeS